MLRECLLFLGWLIALPLSLCGLLLFWSLLYPSLWLVRGFNRLSGHMPDDLGRGEK